MLGLLREMVVLMPLNHVMPDVANWLKTPTKGRTIVLPQAAVRCEWARRGLGVAFAYLEPQISSGTDDRLDWVELPERIGSTNICFYFRGKKGEPDPMSAEAEGLVKAIRTRYAKESD